MLINSTLKMSVLRKAMLALVALSFFQLAVGARQSGEGDIITIRGTGFGNILGLARGDKVRFSAFNPLETESGRRNETINLRITLFSGDGTRIAESAVVEIPPGEFRSIDFNRDELPFAGEPQTGRLQVRTRALWGLRARGRILLTTSLETVDSTGQTRVAEFSEFTISKPADVATAH